MVHTWHNSVEWYDMMYRQLEQSYLGLACIGTSTRFCGETSAHFRRHGCTPPDI